MKKEFKATLETRTSKKGNQYEVLVIKLTDKLEKLVFLEQAELELLKLSSNNSLPLVNKRCYLIIRYKY